MASRSYLHKTMRMASLISDSWSEEKEGRWCRISQINCSFMGSSVFEDMIPDLGVISELSNNLTTSFQAGVNTLYNACVSCGVTPSAKTPAAISAAISAISTNRYNAGRTQGQNDVKGSPNSYGLYTGAQYTANYNAGYNAGRASVINTNYRITVLLKADVYNGSNEFTGEQAFTAQTIDIVNGAVSTSFPTNGHPNQALNRPGIGSYSGGAGWHMVNLKSISVAKI